jgi:pimeloyl-ACP methyl ester carboxylesterase
MAGIGLGVVAILALVGSCSTTVDTTATTATTTGAPVVSFVDKLVDVSGHQAAVSCQGNGPRTVLFVGDIGQTGAMGWGQSGVPAAVSLEAVACTFDRPGLGKSQAGSQPRSIPNQVTDLDALISSAGLTTPLVLVSQGYGTLIARQFAQDHRKSVSGLVLIDPPLWPFDIQVPADATPGVRAEYESLFQVNLDLGAYGAGALPPPPAPTLVIGVDGNKPGLPPTVAAGADLHGVIPTTTMQPLPPTAKQVDSQRQLSQKSPFGSFQLIDAAGAYAQYWAPDQITAAITTILDAKPVR